nr:uncharacterized protein LOC123495088 [Aegilops tauschii subsp. strangulata]
MGDAADGEMVWRVCLSPCYRESRSSGISMYVWKEFKNAGELIFSKKEHIKGEKSYLSGSSDTFLMLLRRKGVTTDGVLLFFLFSFKSLECGPRLNIFLKATQRHLSVMEVTGDEMLGDPVAPQDSLRPADEVSWLESAPRTHFHSLFLILSLFGICTFFVLVGVHLNFLCLMRASV